MISHPCYCPARKHKGHCCRLLRTDLEWKSYLGLNITQALVSICTSSTSLELGYDCHKCINISVSFNFYVFTYGKMMPT